MEQPVRGQDGASRRLPDSGGAGREAAKSPIEPDIFPIGDVYNEAWRQTRRGARVSFVRSPLIRASDTVMAIGSCFALEVRMALGNRGFAVLPRYAEIDFDPRTQKLAKLPIRDDISHFNTFTIRTEFEQAFAGSHFRLEHFVRHEALEPRVADFGGGAVWQDPCRKTVFAASEAAIADLSRKIDASMRDAIMRADVYVITLGLTEVWRDDRTGMVVNYTPEGERDGRAPGFTFEQSSYEQNYDNVRAVCALLAERFPHRPVVLTVSPVALSRTFSGADIVVANMESKSILRAVAGAVSRQFESVVYFPSYEMAATRDIYKSDGRHVTAEGVSAIMDQFMRVHLEA